MDNKETYIKADKNHVEMQGKGKNLLALLGAIVSSFKYNCDFTEEEIQLAVDFGLKHNASKMEEDEEKTTKRELESELEKLMKLLLEK